MTVGLFDVPSANDAAWRFAARLAKPRDILVKLRRLQFVRVPPEKLLQTVRLEKILTERSRIRAGARSPRRVPLFHPFHSPLADRARYPGNSPLSITVLLYIICI